jgi:hypothetical protein
MRGDQDVDFAALRLLSGVATHLVVFAAPRSADLTDWLTRIAAEARA